MHNYLYKVSYNGKNFFVKELLNPVYPVDAVTQFETHTRLVGINEVMRQWNAASFRTSWAGKTPNSLFWYLNG